MNVETLVHEELVNRLEKLKGMKEGSEEHKATLDEVTKLLDKAIDMERLGEEKRDKIETRKFENELKLKQFELDKWDRVVKHTLTGVTIVGGITLTVWGSITGWKFEETGTVVSPITRKFTNSLIFWK
jgi:hypothetical protein